MADITQATIEVLRTPDFQYSGFYFPEIAARLRRYQRVYAPEITNESMLEPFIQMERAFALIGHYNNVLADMIANEVFIETARHPTSVKYHLGLIDYRMLPASPGIVEIVGKLARTYASDVRVLEANRKFATRRNQDEEELVFENADPLDFSAATNAMEMAYSVQYENTGVCFTSSLEPDIIQVSSGYQFVTADLHKPIDLTGSILGNNVEDIEIVELLEETFAGSGIWTQARLKDASFVSETDLTFVVRSISANIAPDLEAATGYTIWGALAPVENDKFYFGHSDVMWNRFDIVLAAAAPLGPEGVWEFYDTTETTIQPDSVEVDPSPGVLRFNVNTLLGVTSAKGAIVKVQYLPSGFETNVVSEFTGSNNHIDVSGYMGQVIPSTDAGDYLVYSDWRPIDITDITTQIGLQRIATSGYTKFNLPQSSSDRWEKYTVYDIDAGEEKTGYLLRYRIVDNSGLAMGPDFTSMSFITGQQYTMFEGTQGRTVEDDPLGSSTGETSQEFTLTRSPYILNSIRVFVDEGGGFIEWSEVDSFLTSYQNDRHFRVDIQTDGTAIIIFSDGINGRVPPIGTNNVTAIYRIGANENGNIAPSTLTVNRDGVGVFKEIYNPRSGAFWVEADWDSVESLEKVKLRGPYNLRTMYRAVTARDCEILAASYINPNGVRPIARARAYEEAFGPKTVEIVVVGQGGASLQVTSREEVLGYFNGDETYNGVLVLNHEAYITNYTPRKLGIEMEVIANSIVTRSMVIQTLSFLLSPTAVENDGVTYVWQFGQEVPLSRINAEIFRISPGNVFKVNITTPSDDISLSANELPLFDPVNTNVVMLPPSRLI